MILTNSMAAAKLLRKRKKHMRLQTGMTPTTKRYRDKRGKLRFCGTPRLKKSQTLVILWMCGWFSGFNNCIPTACLDR